MAREGRVANRSREKNKFVSGVLEALFRFFPIPTLGFVTILGDRDVDILITTTITTTGGADGFSFFSLYPYRPDKSIEQASNVGRRRKAKVGYSRFKASRQEQASEVV